MADRALRGAGARLPAPRVAGSLLGMILFITSETMFFGALFGAYFTIRADAVGWPPPGTPEIGPIPTGLFTIALVASSFTQHLGVVAIRRNDRDGLIRWTAVTIGLGAVFLAGQGLEYSQLIGEEFRIGTNVFGTLFYTMTGFHGLHVLGGLTMLTIVLLKARKGHFSSDKRGAGSAGPQNVGAGSAGSPKVGPSEAVGYYWHFVDVVWILLFGVLYILQ